MFPKLKECLVLSIVGFAVLLSGSLGYMGVYALDPVVCYILMGIGMVAVIAAMVMISLQGEGVHAAKEE
jgi:hypothetical protein